MEFETLKGTRDIEPCEQIKINKIISTISKNFESFGFRPFNTPIIEMLNTLTYKYDEDAEIVEEIFKLSDRGNRELGLRYDLTTPLARFVASKKQLKLPFKRYQIGTVFRDGPIKPGRLREFIQCDGDVIGLSGQGIEAELMLMFYNTYKQLKINSIIELNNNKILRGALLQNGFVEEDLQTLILSIDKLKKIGLTGVLAEIKEKNLDTKKAEESIKILSCKNFDEIKKLAKNEELKEGILELENLINLIEGDVEYRINFSMSRGLAIYTGNIWEAYDKDNKITSSIGAGGRYDKVIGEYQKTNEEIPAVGISYGLVPILACLENIEKNKNGVTDILVVPLDENLEKEAYEIAKKLRNVENKNIEIFYGYKMKKAFSYAQYLGCENLAIIGKKDLENSEFTLKNIISGDEEKRKL